MFPYLVTKTNINDQQLVKIAQRANFKSRVHIEHALIYWNVCIDIINHMIRNEITIRKIVTFMRALIKCIVRVFMFCFTVILYYIFVFVRLDYLVNISWRFWYIRVPNFQQVASVFVEVQLRTLISIKRKKYFK